MLLACSIACHDLNMGLPTPPVTTLWKGEIFETETINRGFFFSLLSRFKIYFCFWQCLGLHCCARLFSAQGEQGLL